MRRDIRKAGQGPMEYDRIRQKQWERPTLIVNFLLTPIRDKNHSASLYK